MRKNVDKRKIPSGRLIILTLHLYFFCEAIFHRPCLSGHRG